MKSAQVGIVAIWLRRVYVMTLKELVQLVRDVLLLLFIGKHNGGDRHSAAF